jgi:hypothetical protein
MQIYDRGPSPAVSDRELTWLGDRIKVISDGARSEAAASLRSSYERRALDRRQLRELAENRRYVDPLR